MVVIVRSDLIAYHNYKMPLLEVDPFWNLPCLAYHVQARPDRASIARLVRLQRAVFRISPTALYLIPSNALHLSVATLVRSQQPDIAAALWAKVEGEVRDEISRPVGRHPFCITFEHLIFSYRAVIVRTSLQPTYFTESRTRFGALLTAKGVEFPRYDQSHVTIARYAADIELSVATLALLNRTNLELLVQFEAPRLVREICYPSLRIEEI